MGYQQVISKTRLLVRSVPLIYLFRNQKFTTGVWANGFTHAGLAWNITRVFAFCLQRVIYQKLTCLRRADLRGPAGISAPVVLVKIKVVLARPGSAVQIE